jgi:hypothetical protein
MKLHLATGITGALLLAGLTTTAGAEGVKEVEVYKGNLGKWTCEAKETGSGKMFKATIENTVEFDGSTYVERYAEVASSDHPSAWKSIFIMSYDDQSKRWVRNGVDNQGGRNAASSAGWSGDTWVWENDGVNIVITRSGTKRSFAVDVKDGGNVKRVVEANCKKA